jgi:hypothetical protein
MQRVWIVTIILIILMAIGAFYYGWYFTPRIIAEKSTAFYAPNLFENGGDRTLNETIMNITYKGSMCEGQRMEFPKTLSEDNLNSFFSLTNDLLKFNKKDDLVSGYSEFTVDKINGLTNYGIALWKDKIILFFFCEQTDSNEYIARWFVEKYG